MMHNMAKCLTPILIKTENDREDKLTKRLLYGKKPISNHAIRFQMVNAARKCNETMSRIDLVSKNLLANFFRNCHTYKYRKITSLTRIKT